VNVKSFKFSNFIFQGIWGEGGGGKEHLLCPELLLLQCKGTLQQPLALSYLSSSKKTLSSFL
jgi:hypothetical protein